MNPILKPEFEIKKVQVLPEFEGLRIDVFLTQQALVKSRSQALKLISKERLFINKKLCKKSSYPLKAEDKLTILLAYEKEAQLSHYDFPLSIPFEDEHIVIVEKPAGLVVHPAPGHPDKTLVNIMAHKTTLSSGSHVLRPGVVHRLDKDVSGLLVLAKTKAAEDYLIQQFKTRKIKREYWAISLHTPFPMEGKLESWICRHPVHRKKFISLKSFRPGAKQAISSYKLLHQNNNGLCWLKFRLYTGRTHQIRVHLSSLSCPIAGDASYGGKKNLSFIKDVNLKEQIKNLNRIALHAHSLNFLHPASLKPMIFTSPWPEELKLFLKALKFL